MSGNNMATPAGKVAFITGGASGVGLGQAKVFGRAGVKIAVADVRADHRAEAAEWFARQGLPLLALDLDITDRVAFAQAANEVEAKLGPVQLLCNTCGVSQFGPLQDATYDDWDWQLGVNLGGTINGIQTFVPRMIAHGQGGHIVNTASMAAFTAAPTGGIYCASKFAVRGLTECLHYDLAPKGIGVSLLCPGGVNSNIHEAVLTRPAKYASTGYYGADPERMTQLKSVIAGGMDPEQLAQYVLRAVIENRFYILPYPEFRDRLDEIHQRVIDALARPEDDPTMEERVRRERAAIGDSMRARQAAQASTGGEETGAPD
jgi:NAD(P)-dependent dehydrogenase (short-subunit alcohol dehydrogenase family)